MKIYHSINGESRLAINARDERRVREYYIKSVNKLMKILPEDVKPVWANRYVELDG
jgi:hypothetical protein